VSLRHILGILVVWFLLSLHCASCQTAKSPAGCELAPEASRLVRSVIPHNGITDTEWSPITPLPCETVARIARASALEVVDTRWDPLVGTFDVRLRCNPPTACLPFLVRVERNASSATPRALPSLADRPLNRRVSANSVPRLVKPGQLVTLLVQNGSMRITNQVVCLDAGAAGDQIRTRSKNGGRVVRARVLTASLVEAQE
jgi:hypothetical protein